MIKASPLLIAQITDTHLLASPNGELLGMPTQKSFEAVVERLAALYPKPDILLLTGDLSQDETARSYQRLQESLLPLGIPTYWLPGNHDQFLVMRAVLQQPPISPSKSFRAGAWQFILLDSSVPGQVHGYLTNETLGWLEQQLQYASDRPTLISLHHPPFQIDSRWIDQSRLRNPEALFAIIDRYRQVRLVLFGHIHQSFCHWRGQVCYLASPSTSIQFKPKSDRFCLDKDLQPGFRLLSLYPDGSFETHIERVACAQPLDLAATGY